MIFTAHHPRALDVPNQAVNVRLPQPCTQKQTVSTVQQSRHMETLGGHATQLHIAEVRVHLPCYWPRISSGNGWLPQSIATN